MHTFNFTELMCKVDAIADLNTKELLLYEARAHYQQTVLSIGNAYLMQIDSTIAYIQKVKELSVTFSQPADEIRQKSNNLKIATCLIFGMLNLLGKGRGVNDLTAMAAFASLVTGHSGKSITKIWQDILFSQFAFWVLMLVE